jgi:kynureninase
MNFVERATELDASDRLARYRNEFVITDDLVYLDGNSLGRLPKATIKRLRAVVEEEWASELVMGWNRWLDIGLEIGERLAPLLGAEPHEVALCDQTSINLFKLATAGLAHSGRTNIITDSGNFPSDRYVLEGVAASAGGSLVFAPEDPTADDIVNLVTDDVGLVSLSHVSYRSGTMLDAAAITSAAHAGGALMLWDLAHSAGSVPVDLSGWNADLAVGCTYKYLNAGPGAPGFLFVRSDLITKLDPPIPGWYAHADQFAMAKEFVAKDNIGRFVVGTPSVIAMAAADEGIRLSAGVGIAALRAKSLALTDFFIASLTESGVLGRFGFEVITPEDHNSRGSQVTIRHPEAYRISHALRRAKVIPDFRAPDLVRFGFTPLTTTFDETARAVNVLADIMERRSYEDFDAIRSGVT